MVSGHMSGHCGRININQTTREMRTRLTEQKRLNQAARRARAEYYEPLAFVRGELTEEYRAMTRTERMAQVYRIQTRRLGEALPA